MVLGDIDGDGDLDFVTANDAAGTASVRFNDGLGNFSGNQEVSVGANPYCVTLGDIDGDGDLDLLTGNPGGGNISIRFNDGAGNFSGGTDLATGGYRLSGLTLGDLDGDGDLDLVGASYLAGAVFIRLNNGAGVFSGSTNLAFSNARNVALGDMDADGDLDLVAVSGNNPGLVAVWLNNGSATFTAGQSLDAGNQAYGVALGDLDGDGDLDLAVASRITSSLTMFLNNGTGTYTSAPAVPIDSGAYSVAFGDVDGDGDLDLLTANLSGTSSVRLNQAPAPAITSFTPTSGVAGTSVVITGTNFTGATAVAFNGTAASGFVVNSATQITATVAPGSSTGTISVTTPGGTATSSQPFTVIPPPTLTAVAPNPGGLGQRITLTGTNLDSPTALTINGADALAGILSNTGTSLTVRVPATAAATGNVSLTTASGTATAPFTVMPAPGNALAFDGTDDYVSVPAGLNTANFTFEAWIKYQDNGFWTRIFDFGTGTNTWMILTAKTNYGFNSGYLGFGIVANRAAGAEVNILSTTPLPVGTWQHVAVTLATTGSVTAGTLYLNGQVIGTNPNLGVSPAALGTLTQNWLGKAQYPDPLLKASLDEVRVWNTARTQAQVQADMLAPATAPYPAGLQFYLNTDQGTPATASTGNNTGLTTLYDVVNGAPATLNNFALSSGNTTSNYVESYAMVVPTATAATNAAATGFTATWTAPALGTVTSYLLDVSTSATFASVISGSPFTVAGGTLSRALTGPDGRHHLLLPGAGRQDVGDGTGGCLQHHHNGYLRPAGGCGAKRHADAGCQWQRHPHGCPG